MRYSKIDIISQKDLESRQYVAIMLKDKMRTGWAYRNGSNIRVKSFEHGKWVNRIARAGADLALFENVSKTNKKFEDVFGSNDFPLQLLSRNDLEKLRYHIIGLLNASDQVNNNKLIKQTKLSSKSFIAFKSADGETHYGWAFRNGSTIRVKSFENPGWKNRTIPCGVKVLVFKDVPKTKKGIDHKFCDKDFPLFEYCEDWKSTNKTLHKWLLEEIGEILSVTVTII